MRGNFVSANVCTSRVPQKRTNQFFPSSTNDCSQPSLPQKSSSRESENKQSALIVDDASDVTEMLSVLLSHAGYNVVTAHSARAAIAASRERHFDVIISDIGMPEMNGYELARALRALPGYEAVPMVAVTGYSMFDDRERSLRSGFNAHMTKPIEPRALLDLIEQL
jgi:two-component system, chemotaxis family, CheB/CheR fusion protein